MLPGIRQEPDTGKPPPSQPNEALQLDQLANTCATAIDQKRQHNDKQYTGNDPDNRYIVHVKSPFCSLA
jgi:hypothetical protein